LPKSANSGTASTIMGGSGNLQDIIEVEAITLDEFVREENISGKIDLIKIDIEGAELFALQGMREVLSKNKPALILEINDEMMGLAGYSAKDIQNYLSEFGYKAYEMTKKGLRGPLSEIHSVSENYCFLTDERIQKSNIRGLIFI